jgi:AcrR family transcriptional regulator
MASKTSRAKTSKAKTGKATTGKARTPADAGESAIRALDAALELAAERGWRHVTLGDIAAAARLSLAELYALYPGRAAILAAILRRTDAAVLADGVAEGETARDRLFEIVMRRFDALAPHKAGIEAILRDARRDPLAALFGAKRLMRSMGWMLEAAGIDSHGIFGRARCKGLAFVYLAALRVWLSDDSPDLSQTMAALDKGLRRAESLASLCARLDGRRRGAGDADASAAAA